MHCPVFLGLLINAFLQRSRLVVWQTKQQSRDDIGRLPLSLSCFLPLCRSAISSRFSFDVAILSRSLFRRYRRNVSSSKFAIVLILFRLITFHMQTLDAKYLEEFNAYSSISDGGIWPKGTQWVLNFDENSFPVWLPHTSSLLALAMYLGPSLGKASPHGKDYFMLSLSRHENQKEGPLAPSNLSYSLAFTTHGVAVLRNGEEIFRPLGFSDRTLSPQLFYEYEYFAYMFCDVEHFVPKNDAWALMLTELGLPKKTFLNGNIEGEFVSLNDYMGKYPTDDDNRPLPFEGY